MLSFKSAEKFNIKEHGDVFVVEDHTLTHGQMREAIGKPILINDVKFKCKGYERFATKFKESDIIPSPFGVLVGEIK